MTSRGWEPDDLLGPAYETSVIDLGQDPDGEGAIRATLVRATPASSTSPAAHVVLHLPGWCDYFFHTAMADFFLERGFAFYSIDLRKCGRSRSAAHTPHFVSAIDLYFAELDIALDVALQENPGAAVTIVGHSTGGLIAALWLDDRRRRGLDPVQNVVLNSPWLDLQLPAVPRQLVTTAASVLARRRPYAVLPLPADSDYGASLHVGHRGAWDFDIALKPLEGLPVTAGWMAAIRAGHARLHRGVDVGAPVLVLHSARSTPRRHRLEQIDTSDAVLDVTQIRAWAHALSADVRVVEIEGARHDVFLSERAPREAAYAAVDRWLAA